MIEFGVREFSKLLSECSHHKATTWGHVQDFFWEYSQEIKRRANIKRWAGELWLVLPLNEDLKVPKSHSIKSCQILVEGTLREATQSIDSMLDSREGLRAYAFALSVTYIHSKIANHTARLNLFDNPYCTKRRNTVIECEDY